MGNKMNTKQAEPNQRPKPSCIAKLDALYFCYSPVYQMQQYYRIGELDNCFGKFDEFYQCVVHGTKLASKEVHADKPEPFWVVKDRETAKKDWEKVFSDK